MSDKARTLIMMRRLESTQDGLLDMWTIYRSPRDAPDKFVARRFVLDRPTFDVITADALEELRTVFEEAGFTCMTRAESDDPVIVEVWL